MNEQYDSPSERDAPVRKLKLGYHGLISFDVEPNVPYKYMLHESKQWVDHAQKLHPRELEEIDYTFDSLGFRNNKEIEEVSSNKEWCLFESACFGLGPGIPTDKIVPNLLEKYTDIPQYNMSIFGDRPEFICNNLLELSKRWVNPPSKIILHLVENPTGTFALSENNKIINIDYAGSMMPAAGKEFTFHRAFEEASIPEGQHRLFYKNVIDLCELLQVPLTWIYTGLQSDITPLNYLQGQDNITSPQDILTFANGPGLSVGHFNSSMSYEERRDEVRDTIVIPMTTCNPAKGVELDEVGRDLFHAGIEQHEQLARKIMHKFWLHVKRL